MCADNSHAWTEVDYCTRHNWRKGYSRRRLGTRLDALYRGRRQAPTIVIAFTPRVSTRVLRSASFWLLRLENRYCIEATDGHAGTSDE